LCPAAGSVVPAGAFLAAAAVAAVIKAVADAAVTNSDWKASAVGACLLCVAGAHFFACATFERSLRIFVPP